MGEGADGRITAEKIAAASISTAKRADEAVANRHPMPLDEGLNDDAMEMDRAIAHEVFGIPLETLDAWPFPLPAFSTERREANRAMTAVWGRGGAVRAVLDAELAKTVALCVPADWLGYSSALVVLCPDAVCSAVLTAVRTSEVGSAQPPSATDRPACHEADTSASAGSTRGIPACEALFSACPPAARATGE